MNLKNRTQLEKDLGKSDESIFTDCNIGQSQKEMNLRGILSKQIAL